MSATWVVTSDTPDQFSTTGTPAPVIGHQITFITGNGNRGSVFVPNDHYNEAAVRALIQPQADEADKIAVLTHKA